MEKATSVEIEMASLAVIPTGSPMRNRISRLQGFFTIIMTFSSFICNFDTSYAGLVLIMPSFKKAFGHCQMVPSKSGELVETCTLAVIQQSLIGLTTIFIAIGSLVSGPISNKIGRRKAIQLGCIITSIGAAGMLGTKRNFVAYMACKCIGGIGIGLFFTVGSVYGAEAAPPHKRGFLMALYNFGHSGGNLTASLVCLGSSKLTSDWAWMTPIICQIPVAAILFFGIMPFPESPRWLLMKGREDEARASFARFFNDAPDSEAITLQVQVVKENLEKDVNSQATNPWVRVLKKPNLRRTAIASLVLYGNAVTGIAFVLYYAPLFLSNVGIPNPYLVNSIIGICIFVGTCPGPFFAELLGRRICLMGGYSAMATCMLIIAVMGTTLDQTKESSKILLVVFLCLWALFFSSFAAACIWTTSAEVHSVPLRAYGQAVAGTVYQIFLFAASFWSPYTLSPKYGNMGAKIGFLYFGITVLQITLIALFVPETARVSLEQIDEYFASGLPAWKTSITRNKKRS